VRNKEKIQELATIIEEVTNKIADLTEDADAKKGLLKYLKYFTFFKDAPVLILVFASPYPNTPYDLLLNIGLKEEAERILYASSGIQNIGAAMENLLLAAANLGYGACWIAGPIYAGIEIERAIGFDKEGYKLVAMTPLGVPESKEQLSPPRKPLEEVVTFID
ncbi:nitroreductase family protein, partial [Alkaliphilus sp. AH-315-G20]|nr:nitroreductase family protein [Alkaliphilus sp. AH-315-G20]